MRVVEGSGSGRAASGPELRPEAIRNVRRCSSSSGRSAIAAGRRLAMMSRSAICRSRTGGRPDGITGRARAPVSGAQGASRGQSGAESSPTAPAMRNGTTGGSCRLCRRTRCPTGTAATAKRAFGRPASRPVRRLRSSTSPPFSAPSRRGAVLKRQVVHSSTGASGRCFDRP